MSPVMPRKVTIKRRRPAKFSRDPFIDATVDAIDEFRRAQGWFVLPREMVEERLQIVIPR